MRSNARATVGVLAAATAAALVLSACGRSETPEGEGEPTASAIEEGPATGTIEVWAMGTEGEALEEFAATFEEANPDATVNVTAVPWDAAHDKITTAIAGGQTPDVSMIGTTWMGEMALTGALDPTPDIIDSSTFFPGGWDSTVVGGTSYGVPWYVETRVLYYRSDLAERAGVEAPTDWEGLTEFATAIQDGGAEWGINLQPGQTGAWQTFMPFAWQAGAEITNDDETEFTFDSPEFVAALEKYQSFFTDGLAPTDLPEGSLEPGFVDGTIGSFVSGPWHVGILRDTGGEEFVTNDLALTPLPADAQPASFIGGSNLSVFESSENRDAAWKFVQWLSEPETQVAWYETVNDLPSVQSAWDDPAIADDPFLGVFGDQLDSAQAPPAVPTWEQITSVIDTELEKLCKTGADPQEVATAIQTQASAIGTGL
ncbi:extracellular solute-binding protein family 1 [Beutenbergia cavernae DSM 12333]|uniref:Extracellular solute-binding protein family 1 n=1 Tax=Beutenbergia cavernae (strain ATCC BAA-8 / DSM 12333 / CCUG 43141 / JCM 11478 / NBRC 16432 / NCIMB 13614 / HKI 0122) TaxID=471853 RepID=C5C2X0_BEUC1|nr:sugar ABC transporter substrate-binding protein [Beutenbergia cavernae]ACQ81814.1 extracellular solute-binding protein family 1 [Beutenbergia cavernae DSM 12333]